MASGCPLLWACRYTATVIKPSHQWETRAHQAVRVDTLDADADLGPRAERFELRFGDHSQGWAACGLTRQVVDTRGAKDPDLVHAVSCWLIARGARTIDLRTDTGERLAEGAIHPAELGVALDARHPEHALVSLCPSNAEALWALEVFGRVVACEDSSDFPPEVEDRERLGPDLGPDLDRVAAIAGELERPLLAVSSLSVPGMERVVTGLRARGIAQVVLAPRGLDDVLAGIERLGAALDDAALSRARAVVADMRGQIGALETAAARRPRPARVYLEWWPRPMFTPGAACYSNELIRLAGGVNVFGERPGSSLEISTEELVAAAPEVCFVSWCGVAEDKLDPRRLIERPGLEDLPAAQEGAVHRLDERFSGRPGPRMLEAARRMAAAIDATVDSPA